MSSTLQATGQYNRREREFIREPIGKPMLVAILFHALLFGGIAAYAIFSGLFHRDSWGGANDGAVSVQVVSNALPLPSDHTPNNNVLAAQTPSEAPAPPAPKAPATVDEKAIPIPTKIEAPKKPADKKQQESKDKTPPTQQTVAKAPLHAQPNVKPDNHAQFGEQAAGAVPRSTVPANATTVGATSVTSSGSKGFNYPYYVTNINRKVQQNTNLREVDARTPRGTQANILFTIRRDGSASDFKIDRASGSQTLDQACLRAAQRVDTFGALPSPPADGPLNVSYHCDYQGP